MIVAYYCLRCDVVLVFLIFCSLQKYVFVVLSSMTSTMLFFFLPKILLYLCQNWFSSQDSIRNFRVFFFMFYFWFYYNCWSFILAVCSISRLAMLCFLLNLWLAFLSSFLDFFYVFTPPAPLLSFFVTSVCPKKRVALFITMSVSFFCLFLLLLSLLGILLGNLLDVVLGILSILPSLHFLF